MADVAANIAKQIVLLPAADQAAAQLTILTLAAQQAEQHFSLVHRRADMDMLEVAMLVVATIIMAQAAAAQADQEKLHLIMLGQVV